MKKLIFAVLVAIVAGGLAQKNTDPTASLITSIVAIVAMLYIFYCLFFKPLHWVYKKVFKRTKSSEKQSVTQDEVVSNSKDVTARRLADLEARVEKAERRGSTDIKKHAKPQEGETMDHLEPQHNLLVLSINKSVSDGAEIYNATRYAWKLNVEKARKADFVLAHQSGRVVGVFEVDEWLPADDPELAGLGDADSSRWGFVGKVAPSEVLMKYFNKQLPEGFLKRGAAIPVRFLSIDGVADDASSDENLPTGSAGTAETMSSINCSSSGRVDSDGDFSATVELDISAWGEEEDLIYFEGDVEVRIAGEVDDSRVYESAQVADNTIEVRSSFVRVSDDIDPEYKVAGSLDIFRFG